MRQSRFAPAMTLCAALALLAGPALAADALKDLLGEAQRSQQKAVEDLIGKLESKSKPKPAEPALTAPIVPETAATTPPASAPSAPPAATEPEPKAADAKAGSSAKETQPAEKAEAKPDVTPPSSPPPAAIAEPQPPAAQPAAPQAPAVAVTPAPASPSVAKAPPPPELPAAPPPAQVAEAALPSVELDVYFDFNSSAITQKAIDTLAPLGKALNDPRLANAIFLIAGHTDAKGNPSVNQQLSVSRADAVREYLVRTFGISHSRLVSRGFGQTRLKDRDDPLSEMNRRVQIVNVTEFARN